MKTITGLLIEAKIIDAKQEVIEMASINQTSFLRGPYEALLSIPKYQNRQFSRMKYQYEDCEFNFFLEKDNKETVKVFLENSIQEAMSKTGYEDARRFRQIKENYGEQLSNLLTKKKDDPIVKQQLLRMLDF